MTNETGRAYRVVSEALDDNADRRCMQSGFVCCFVFHDDIGCLRVVMLGLKMMS